MAISLTDRISVEFQEKVKNNYEKIGKVFLDKELTIPLSIQFYIKKYSKKPHSTGVFLYHEQRKLNFNEPVYVCCLSCNKSRTYTIYCIIQKIISYNYTTCYSCSATRWQKDPKKKKRLCEIRRKIWQNPQVRAKLSASIKRTANTPESKAKRSLISRQTFVNDPTIKKRISESVSAYWKSLTKEQQAKSRKAWSEGLKKKWADPEHKKKHLTAIMRGMKKHVTTKGQKELFAALDSKEPHRWKLESPLCVDGNVFFPDMRSEKDKLIVEYCGDYWHAGLFGTQETLLNTDQLKAYKNDLFRQDVLLRAGWTLVCVSEKRWKGDHSGVLSFIKSVETNNKIYLVT